MYVATTDRESVEVVHTGDVARRTIRIPDFVPDDHKVIYFTGATTADLIRAALRWVIGGKD